VAKSGTPPAPRTFFLNELHELARAEKQGGGRSPQYGSIDWNAKGNHLATKLKSSRETILKSRDPVRDRHYFMVAMPVPSVPKISKDKRKAPTGEFLEDTRYDGQHSRVFRRLGIDLLDVSADGSATVHASTERLNRLVATATSLGKEGPQERARWATIGGFEPVPLSARIDEHWLASVSKTKPTDVIVELQPPLSRVEVEEVLTAIAHTLEREAAEMVVGAGTDFSGRRWFRARVRRNVLRQIAETFFSVQSLHPPYITAVAAAPRTSSGRRAEVPPSVPPTLSVSSLPTVAVVDTGIPAEHGELSPYVRGRYQQPNAPAPYLGDHACLVASRVIFGDLDFSVGEAPRPAGRCRVLDAMVAKDPDAIEDKEVMPALQAIIATSPDVRVFNFSFAEIHPRGDYATIEQRERLINVRDLDNFIFVNDVLVVVAAGNSPRGMKPAKDYPHHIDEPAWQLAAWPSGFNSLTCGAIVGIAHPEGLVKTVGWPSPLTRIGPGVADAPIPEFGASGGNLADDWSWRTSLGVWGCTAGGIWEDRAGSSFAAPLLAREVAFALHTLQTVCAPGARPFGVTAKAFLALTAERPGFPPAVSTLADRTIGRGQASTHRLHRPGPDSAVMIWQGVIDGPSDVVRVQVPIPRTWLKLATRPILRLVCSWDPPVNDAVRSVWACRKISVQLRPSPEGPAARGSQGDHSSYPLVDRTYDLSLKHLKSQKKPIEPTDDLWVLELSYELIAEYFVGMAFPPQQRVAFAAELRDVGEKPVSPQTYIQALPVAATMVRLAMPPAPVPAPVILRRT
jgi:hypothetical protein